MSDPQADRPTLTTRQGHPVHNNQQQRTVGSRGPATLENYHFLKKISHFDRERIPERVVHARGFVAHGEFEAYGTIGDEPAATYTRAKLFQTRGAKTPVTIRFSTVIGGRDSSEAARDPRGFAVKFRTGDGNWDLVGNNLQVFFIRDAIKFPDVIHSLKPDPVTFRQEPNRIFDLMSDTPESMHMLTWLFSPYGIPRNYRTMRGSGVNYLPPGERPGRGRARQVPLVDPAGRAQPDPGRGGRDPGHRAGPRLPGPVRGDRTR
ncbi:catalase [Micromonospora lupini]|uniref:catalase n=1 Tax=Micromonospora lupini str. Lupac 08 TaxID=1150864 RepID=I0LAW6_9ACTN